MDEFMNVALDEAYAGSAEGGIPIGAALVGGGTPCGNRSKSQIAKFGRNHAC